METKTCNICNENKLVAKFYTNAAMRDGYQNRCIECTKKKMKERQARIMKDRGLHEKEKKRLREKYHRLNYRKKHKQSPEKRAETLRKHAEKYPEKRSARRFTLRMKPLIDGNELHHWSYNIEHWRDIIEIPMKDHYTIHRYLKYDRHFKMYRTRNGVLLDSKELHESYIKLVLTLP